MTTLDKMLQGLANALGASLSTLTTTAKTVVGAINELKSGLTTTNTTVSGHTSTIGSGSLDTTSQTLIGAVNELKANIYTPNLNSFSGTSYSSGTTITTYTPTKNTFILFGYTTKSSGALKIMLSQAGSILLQLGFRNPPTIGESDTTVTITNAYENPGRTGWYSSCGILLLKANVTYTFQHSQSYNNEWHFYYLPLN